ncbi:MAG: bifunctional glycosyltransferase family 2/GtrA family protein [Propioniciclava sp.]|uniref:glycosyltransferase n=1 Tax=Propioniciclava sp. TaxID=2038686 RepID=UPI0039E67EDE
MAILIPSYQPTSRLAEVIRGLRVLDADVPILVVDDGSGPAYADQFAAARAAGAEVISVPVNRGKGAALKLGLRRLATTHPAGDVVTADSDGQHTPADILRVAAVTAQGRELVLGCRGFTGTVPLPSRLGNGVSRALFRLAAGFAVSDTQTGLRGIPGVLVGWSADIPGERFEYEQNMLLRCPGARAAVREVPIATVYFDHNAGTHFRRVRDSARVLWPVLLFAASSLASLAVDTVGFVVLLGATGSIAWSIAGARVLSAGVNFAVNRSVVFRAGRGGLAAAVTGYITLALTLLGASIAGTTALAGLGVPALVAKVITESVLFVASYHVQRRYIFTGRRRDAGTGEVAAGGGNALVEGKTYCSTSPRSGQHQSD